MKIGDIVQWESGAGGGNTIKRGKVVAVIEAGRPMILDHLPCMWEDANLSCLAHGNARDHESYLVRVKPVVGQAADKLYWPRVKGLTKCL